MGIALIKVGEQQVMDFEIRVDDLTGSEIIELLREHLDEMYAHTPAESVHALDVSKLKQADIQFWSIWQGKKLAGCGALKQHSKVLAEIKSMRTAIGFQRQGIASKLLSYILEQATKQGFKQISLETGSMRHFMAARNMYYKFGFIECGPFADYVEDPNSLFMTKLL